MWTNKWYRKTCSAYLVRRLLVLLLPSSPSASSLSDDRRICCVLSVHTRTSHWLFTSYSHTTSRYDDGVHYRCFFIHFVFFFWAFFLISIAMLLALAASVPSCVSHSTSSLVRISIRVQPRTTIWCYFFLFFSLFSAYFIYFFYSVGRSVIHSKCVVYSVLNRRFAFNKYLWECYSDQNTSDWTRIKEMRCVYVHINADECVWVKERKRESEREREQRSIEKPSWMARLTT